MPHINQVNRQKFTTLESNFPILETKGELEYIVFRLMKKYVSTREARYSTLHDCVYAVIHAGEEFKRLYLDNREDAAIAANGEA